jgi:hypothetical protein
MDVDPEFLVLARFGVAETSSEFFIIQESWLNMHGPGPLPPEFHDAKVCYPAFYPSRHKLETVVSRKFRLHSQSIDPSIKVAINDLLITGVSYVWLSMLRSSTQILTRFTLFVASSCTAFFALASDIISYAGPA